MSRVCDNVSVCGSATWPSAWVCRHVFLEVLLPLVSSWGCSHPPPQAQQPSSPVAAEAISLCNVTTRQHKCQQCLRRQLYKFVGHGLIEQYSLQCCTQRCKQRSKNKYFEASTEFWSVLPHVVVPSPYDCPALSCVSTWHAGLLRAAQAPNKTCSVVPTFSVDSVVSCAACATASMG